MFFCIYFLWARIPVLYCRCRYFSIFSIVYLKFLQRLNILGSSPCFHLVELRLDLCQSFPVTEYKLEKCGKKLLIPVQYRYRTGIHYAVRYRYPWNVHYTKWYRMVLTTKLTCRAVRGGWRTDPPALWDLQYILPWWTQQFSIHICEIHFVLLRFQIRKNLQ